MKVTGTKVVLNLTGADNMKHVEPDDFVIHLRSFQGGIEHSRYAGKVSNAYTVFAPVPEVEPRFFRWVLKSQGFIQELNATTEQLRDGQSIKFEQFSRIGLPCPPLVEQRRIADFLDNQVTRIDAVVRARQHQIEFVLESRTAAISQEIRGWGPGRVGGWPLVRLRYFSQIITGLTYAPEEICDSDEGTLVLRAGNVQSGHIDLNDCLYVKTSIPDVLRCRAGDILLCSRNGSVRLIGKNAMIPDDLAGSTFGAFMTTLRSDDNPWIYWVLQSDLFASMLGMYATATINQLTIGMLSDLSVPLPPSSEQTAICSRLAAVAYQHEAIAQRLSVDVTLLNEYKQSLITAAVTGEVNVSAASGRGVPA